MNTLTRAPFLVLSALLICASSATTHAAIVYALRTDGGSGQIVRFDTANPIPTLTTLASSSAWTGGMFPQGLDFGPDGQLYALMASGEFYRVNPSSGLVTTLPTIARPGGVGFFQDLARDPATGDLLTVYVNSSVSSINRIYRVSTSAIITPLLDIAAPPGFFSQGLAIGGDQRYYVCTSDNIYVLAGADGATPVRLGTGTFGPSALYGLGIDLGGGGGMGVGTNGSDRLIACRNLVQFANADGGPGQSLLPFGTFWDVATVPAPSAAVGLLLVPAMLMRRQRTRVQQ